MKKSELQQIIREEVRKVLREESVISDNDLKNNINKLKLSDLDSKALSYQFDWDSVDEDLLLKQILDLIKKVNPTLSDQDLEKKKKSFSGSNILAGFNDKLYNASWRSYSVERGLKDYFEDNLEIFK